MRKVGVMLVAFFCSVSACKAADKLTVSDALTILQALKSLDEHVVILKKNGQDDAVKVPWDFNNATLRWRIAGDIAALSALEKNFIETKNSLIKEATKGDHPVDMNSPEAKGIVEQLEEILKQPVPDALNLVHIKLADLKLDKNEIPNSILAALKPILDE